MRMRLDWTMTAMAVVLCSSCGGDGGAGGTDIGSSSSETDPTDPSTTTDDPSSSSTTTDPSTTTTGMSTTTGTPPVCGDGQREDPEECDDGNTADGDGCESDCTLAVDTQVWEVIEGGDAGVADRGEGIATDGAGNVYVIGVETDFLFPLEQQREIAQGLEAGGQQVHFAALPSLQGHDAFLVDRARFAPLLKQHFQHLAR